MKHQCVRQNKIYSSNIVKIIKITFAKRTVGQPFKLNHYILKPFFTHLIGSDLSLRLRTHPAGSWGRSSDWSTAAGLQPSQTVWTGGGWSPGRTHASWSPLLLRSSSQICCCCSSWRTVWRHCLQPIWNPRISRIKQRLQCRPQRSSLSGLDHRAQLTVFSSVSPTCFKLTSWFKKTGSSVLSNTAWVVQAS